MKLLDGKLISKKIKQEIALECIALKKIGIVPHLAAILVGNDGASESYVSSKVKDCAEVGIKSSLFRFENSVSEKQLLEKIIDINSNPDIHGLIVQLPLPKHISVEKVTNTISPLKDVDGFHPENIGKMNKNLDTFISATPLGILMMLESEKIETAGKHCVVVGRSHIVGLPMSVLMARNAYPGNCTVTLCHSKTVDLKKFTQIADILIVALGKPEFLKGDMVKEGAIVIDVGISRVEKIGSKNGYVIKGDVDFESVAPKCQYISPVPGGVGPMTRAGLLKNTLISAKRQA